MVPRGCFFLKSSAQLEKAIKPVILKAMPYRIFHRFFKSQNAGSLLLLLATIGALVVANSPFAAMYTEILHTKIDFAFQGSALNMSIQHWINDGLMALFFLVVGLEIKREFLNGELSSMDKAALPLICAAGGVIMPALIYILINRYFPDNWPGWAIPTATDIAFALGILALGGRSVPLSLKVFLTALAIIDDLIAILIIALFYGDPIKIDPFLVAVGILFVLVALNLMRVRQLWPYLIAGACLWLAVLESGLHATLAGVALAATIPVNLHRGTSPLHRLEHALQPVSALIIVPLFALANAGLSFAGLGLDAIVAPLPIGIGIGLFCGKQIGIYYCGRIAIHMKWANLPEGVSRLQFYAVSCLAGVGFTMSLFIGMLAFDGPEMINSVRIGVIGGSLLSAILGVVVLRYAAGKKV